MRACVIAILCTVVCVAQTREYPCTPAPEVAEAALRVEHLRLTVASDLFLEQARADLGKITAQHPDDTFAHLRYLALFRSKGHADVVARYRKLLDSHPGSPRHELWYAASLIGNDTPEAMRRLTALSNTPGFPYPYLLLGEIHSFPKFHNVAAVSANLIRFVESCPDYLPAYELLSYLGQGDRLAAIAAGLRKRLDGRVDPDAARAFRWLWALEFRAAPPEDHEAVRARVVQDLALLQKHYSPSNVVSIETFRSGYRLTGNQAALNALPAQSRPSEELYDVSGQWYKEHPFPGLDVTPLKREEHYRALANQARKWIERWPNEPMPYLNRFQGLAALPETSEDDLAFAAAELIAVNRKRPLRYMTSPAEIVVAREYVNRGIRLDRVPEMLRVGLVEAEARRMAPESDLFDDRNHRMNETTRFQAHIQARGVEFDLAMKRSSTAQARSALDAMRDDIERLVAVSTQQVSAQFLDAEYWTKMSRLAEHEGRVEDAELYRRTAAERRNAPRRSTGSSGSAPAATGKDVTPLRATAVDGRVWAGADLKGKVAVINVWATWCPPCIEELPRFQELYEEFKETPNLLFLTLNIDANPGVVAPFLKSRNYNFPILLASEFVNQLLPEMSIPRNWIVTDGVIATEVPYMQPDQWKAAMRKAITSSIPK